MRDAQVFLKFGGHGGGAGDAAACARGGESAGGGRDWMLRRGDALVEKCDRRGTLGSPAGYGERGGAACGGCEVG